jgi:hypothetical protein
MLKIAYHPIYKHHLPNGHRFPMMKYDLLPQQLIHEGTCTEANFFEPNFPDDSHILEVHDATYYQDLVNLELAPSAARKIGFPLSKELVQREQIIADGTIKGCEFALENGIAMNIAGGTHHAYSRPTILFLRFPCMARAIIPLKKKLLTWTSLWRREPRTKNTFPSLKGHFLNCWNKYNLTLFSISVEWIFWNQTSWARWP